MLSKCCPRPSATPWGTQALWSGTPTASSRRLSIRVAMVPWQRCEEDLKHAVARDAPGSPKGGSRAIQHRLTCLRTIAPRWGLTTHFGAINPIACSDIQRKSHPDIPFWCALVPI